MRIKLLVTIMIAALMWAGVPAITEAPEGYRAQEISQSAAVKTPEEAQAIALKHAGLTADEVKGLRAEFDRDDGRPEYEVEFRHGDWEYDYTVHAETLEILKHNKEYDPPEVKPTQPTEPKPTEPKPTEPAPQETQPAAPKTITAEEAQAIALKHAGLTAGEVKGLRAEFDRDDGRPEYEVEFRHGDWEFDYTIHAETGEILKHNKEYDPPEAKPTQPTEPKPTEPKPTEPKPTEPKPTTSKTISAEEAKAIALKHAGLTAGEVKGLRAEFDRDDGRPEYEVEFRVGNWEYTYEIHGETGKILDWEKEYDD